MKRTTRILLCIVLLSACSKDNSIHQPQQPLTSFGNAPTPVDVTTTDTTKNTNHINTGKKKVVKLKYPKKPVKK